MQYDNKCDAWAATLYSEPDGPDRLKVTGECTFPTPGYKVRLEKKEPQGINPAVLILEKIVTGPKGIEPQHVVTVPVSFEEQTAVRYDEVQILPDGARIEVKEAKMLGLGVGRSSSA
jgi:hypothetical protein